MVPRLKKDQSATSAHLCAFVTCSRVKFTFTFTFTFALRLCDKRLLTVH